MTRNKIVPKLPEMCTLQLVDVTADGDLLALATDKGWEKIAPICVMNSKKIVPSLEVGDKILARIKFKDGDYKAKPIVRIGKETTEAHVDYGVIEKKGNRYYVSSIEKSHRSEWFLENSEKLKKGDFVSFQLEDNRHFKVVHILKNFGPFKLNKVVSLLVAEKYHLPCEFSEKINKELAKLPSFSKQERVDLTNLAFVTIDGEDSKDFDDAVWAERTPLGFRLGVAIADVCFYVRPESELDREAYVRGNSVYLPNRVIPMLPEKLSNDLCSLRPREKRPVIACFMTINHEGKLLDYEFCRGVIASKARLTYREVQEALDGQKSTNIAPVFKTVIEPIYEAYQALDNARKKRGALELETDELKLSFDKEGKVQSIGIMSHYESAQIIEEFMILANVAAAQVLAKSKLPVMYRVHDRPQAEKLKALAPLLKEMKMKLPDAPALKPSHFNKIIEKCQEKNLSSGIGDLVLRMQSQAQYQPENIGHFGLGLKKYVHFTSPIRRYADLLIHRTLVRALKLPEGGALEEHANLEQFQQTGEHLGITERRAMSAEREVTARYVSDYLIPLVGQDFPVRITGMTQAGIFVRIDDLGAEGLIPMRTLPNDKYSFDANGLVLSAKNLGLTFRMGEKLTARLVEASPVWGKLNFQYVDDDWGINYADKGGIYFAKPQKSAKKKLKKQKCKEKRSKCAKS